MDDRDVGALAVGISAVAFGVFGFLAGSANPLHGDQINQAQETCSVNGGLEKASNAEFICSNGARFSW